jgi:ribokinase
MPVLNFGSLNIDDVYRVPAIVQPGQTLAARSQQQFAGGKGANQSVALARAGAEVMHAGRVGPDGLWLVNRLRDAGVDTRYVDTTAERTGRAVIQVDDAGENAIVVLAGGNGQITDGQVGRVFADLPAGTTVLLQNEVNAVARIMTATAEQEMPICLNPAPMDARVAGYPLKQVGTLVVNRTEAAGLIGRPPAGMPPDGVLDALAAMLPGAEIILTLGADGAAYHGPEGRVHVPARPVDVVDTTAAGDTFIGFYLASRLAGAGPEQALIRATRASAITVGRPGAMDAIPRASEVDV